MTAQVQVDGAVKSLMAYDSNFDGKLSLKDILQFYQDACKDKIVIVRDNLAKMGFRADLKPMPVPGSPSNCLQPRKSYLEMPRWKIAQSNDTFRPLLSLLDLQKEVSKEAIALLNMVCTNKESFWDILKLENRQESEGPFTWQMVFPEDDIKLTMYNYEVINSFVKTPTIQQTHEFVLRDDWVHRFLKAGGFVQLLKQLNRAIELAKDNSNRGDFVSEASSQARKFVARTLRLLALIISILMKAQAEPEEAKEQEAVEQNSAATERYLKEAEDINAAGTTTQITTS